MASPTSTSTESVPDPQSESTLTDLPTDPQTPDNVVQTRPRRIRHPGLLYEPGERRLPPVLPLKDRTFSLEAFANHKQYTMKLDDLEAIPVKRRVVFCRHFIPAFTHELTSKATRIRKIVISKIITYVYYPPDYSEVSSANLQSRKQVIEGIYTQAVGKIFESKDIISLTVCITW